MRNRQVCLYNETKAIESRSYKTEDYVDGRLKLDSRFGANGSPEGAVANASESSAQLKV